jgi:hypothetical protein
MSRLILRVGVTTVFGFTTFANESEPMSSPRPNPKNSLRLAASISYSEIFPFVHRSRRSRAQRSAGVWQAARTSVWHPQSSC